MRDSEPKPGSETGRSGGARPHPFFLGLAPEYRDPERAAACILHLGEVRRQTTLCRITKLRRVRFGAAARSDVDVATGAEGFLIGGKSWGAADGSH